MIRICNIIISLLILGFYGFSQTRTSKNVSILNNSININTLEKDFGEIIQGEKVVFKFELTNKNQNVLIIKHVTTSCGCTLPVWSKKPIKFNKKGIVKIKYDSSKPGKFDKSVFIYTNFDDDPIKLKIAGSVNTPQGAKGSVTKKEFNIDGSLPQKQ